MKLEKIKKTYNDYKLELSWAQVEAIAAALEKDHANVVSDELYAEWQWYMNHVPGPGVDEDAFEQQKVAAGGQAGGTGDVEGGDESADSLPIPMPPGESGADTEGAEPPPHPPVGEEDDLGAEAGPTSELPGEADEAGDYTLPDLGNEAPAKPESKPKKGKKPTNEPLPEPPAE